LWPKRRRNGRINGGGSVDACMEFGLIWYDQDQLLLHHNSQWVRSSIPNSSSCTFISGPRIPVSSRLVIFFKK
jgi:hypothetical protein